MAKMTKVMDSACGGNKGCAPKTVMPKAGSDSGASAELAAAAAKINKPGPGGAKPN
jgi:hypothetical protein